MKCVTSETRRIGIESQSEAKPKECAEYLFCAISNFQKRADSGHSGTAVLQENNGIIECRIVKSPVNYSFVVADGTVSTRKKSTCRIGQVKTGGIFTFNRDLPILPDKSPANAAIAVFRR
jgi:hypothetical protein